MVVFDEQASSSSQTLPLFRRKDTPLLARPRKLSSHTQDLRQRLHSHSGLKRAGSTLHLQKTGWVFGSLVLFSVAFFMMLLIHTRRKVDSINGVSKIASFGDLGFAMCGSIGRFAVDIMIVLAQAEFCVSYLILISNSLAYVINYKGPDRILGLTPKSSYLWGCFPFHLGLNSIPTLAHLTPLSTFADIVDVGAMGVCDVEDVMIFLQNLMIESGTENEIRTTQIQLNNRIERKMEDFDASLTVGVALSLISLMGVGEESETEREKKKKRWDYVDVCRSDTWMGK